MNHRLRFALTDGGFGLLSGEMAANETFIGGKARNMQADKRAVRESGMWTTSSRSRSEART
jgi:hypothetical protein